MKFIIPKQLYENSRLIEFDEYLNRSCQADRIVVRRLYEIMRELKGMTNSEKLKEIEDLLDFSYNKSKQLSKFKVYHKK